MSIYAISDLHLSFSKEKTMDIFGDNWTDHTKKVSDDWKAKVKEDDLVLLPGDLSWANNLEEILPDFKYIDGLPGKKLLLKGNHDYWWTTIKKMKNFLLDNNFTSIDFIHNNGFIFDNYIIAGARGWANSESENDEKILKRENIRLKISLEDGVKKFGEDKKIIVNMHYPPFINVENEDTNFIKTMKMFNVTNCIYGHLHGPSHKDVIEEAIDGIQFNLVSSDYLKFKLLKLI